jgi:hypothetical protein
VTLEEATDKTKAMGLLHILTSSSSPSNLDIGFEVLAMNAYHFKSELTANPPPLPPPLKKSPFLPFAEAFCNTHTILPFLLFLVSK